MKRNISTLILLIAVVAVVVALAILPSPYPTSPPPPKPTTPTLLVILDDTDGNPQTPPNSEGITVDSKGNVYAGLLAERTVVKITPTGEKTVFAQIPGQGNLLGLATDKEDNIYVGDVNFQDPKNSCSCIRKITPSGDVTVFASGIALPNGLAFDKDGNLYVTSSSEGTIYKVSKAGKLELFLQHDLLKSHDPKSQFGANGIAVTRTGVIYVANTADSNIIKISGKDVRIFGPEKGFEGADGVALDSADNLYVAQNRLNVISALTPAGERIVIAENEDSDGRKGELESPASLVFFKTRLYVANADFASQKNTMTEPPYTISVLEIG